jgi:hypothetical protein
MHLCARDTDVGTKRLSAKFAQFDWEFKKRNAIFAETCRMKWATILDAALLVAALQLLASIKFDVQMLHLEKMTRAHISLLDKQLSRRRPYESLNLRGGEVADIPAEDLVAFTGYFDKISPQIGNSTEDDKESDLLPALTFADVRLFRFDIFEQKWQQVAEGDLYITECAEPLTTMAAMRIEAPPPHRGILLDQASNPFSHPTPFRQYSGADTSD